MAATRDFPQNAHLFGYSSTVEQLFLGISIGLGLTVMAGPITLTIIESSIEGGKWAGLASALGTWLSDFVFIGLTIYGGYELTTRYSLKLESPVVYIIGGAILVIFGIIFWRIRKNEVDTSRKASGIENLTGYFFRGVAINTLNPFSIIFWSTIALTMVFVPDADRNSVAGLYLGIMIMLMIGDSLKAFLASWTRLMLSQKAIYVARSGIAILFMVLGIMMIGRIFVD